MMTAKRRDPRHDREASPVLWDELSWPQAEEVLKRCQTILIPCGATEQHGRHLPVNVDTLIAYELAKRVSARTGVPVLPPLWAASSARHGDFPGTVSVRPSTFVAVVCDIVEWLHRQGFREFIFLNQHSWNTGPLETARDNLFFEHPKDSLRFKIWDWWHDVPKMQQIIEQDRAGAAAGWGHGGLTETSQVLYLRPDLVQEAHLENFAGGGSFWHLRMDEYTPHGAVGGRAKEATAALGKELIEDAAEILAELLKKELASRQDSL
jgi:creatinine amidohydrolase